VEGKFITFSAIANTVAKGATEKVNGMTLASTTRRLAVRCTLKSGATTPGREAEGSSGTRSTMIRAPKQTHPASTPVQARPFLWDGKSTVGFVWVSVCRAN
jgi:hypothetical protein